MYVFAVELALELSKTLINELRSGLRAEGSNVQALLVFKTWPGSRSGKRILVVLLYKN